MAHPVFRLGSEFNDFLFAPVGEDRSGMPLSVLSALARIDVDPWKEAAALARLPGGPAAQRLAALLATLPDRWSEHRDCQTIAANLIALLPRPVRLAGSPPGPSPSPSRIGAVTISRTILYALIVACLLGALFFMENHPVSIPVDGAGGSALSAAPSEIPSLNAGP